MAGQPIVHRSGGGFDGARWLVVLPALFMFTLITAGHSHAQSADAGADPAQASQSGDLADLALEDLLHVPGAFVSNVTFSHRAGPKGLALSATFYNVFGASWGDPGSNEHRQEVLPQDGRTGIARLSWRF